MKNLFLIAFLVGFFLSCQSKTEISSNAEEKTDACCQNMNKTAVSLFMKADTTAYLNEISSESGDLYNSIGHHGPAIENEWLALRIYFSKKVAIDAYNKSKPGLELKKAKWYPTAEQQKEGWGADYYKVSNTVGLGGVKLWDGEKVVFLDPVTNRTARVVKEKTSSYIEMLSEGVPYKGSNVDILVRVTVFSGIREAKVEAFALCDMPVQFATGINYHPGQEIQKEEGLIATWGLHPEDVAAEAIKLGAAIMYNNNDYIDLIDDSTQFLLISKPGKQITTWITSACEKEEGINSMEAFLKLINKK